MKKKGAPITALKFAHFLPTFSVSFSLTGRHGSITLTLQGPKQIHFIQLMIKAAQKASQTLVKHSLLLNRTLAMVIISTNQK